MQVYESKQSPACSSEGRGTTSQQSKHCTDKQSVVCESQHTTLDVCEMDTTWFMWSFRASVWGKSSVNPRDSKAACVTVSATGYTSSLKSELWKHLSFGCLQNPITALESESMTGVSRSVNTFDCKVKSSDLQLTSATNVLKRIWACQCSWNHSTLNSSTWNRLDTHLYRGYAGV